MIFELYAIKDELSEFASPITIETEDQAKRYFKEMVKRTTLMNENKKDFSLWNVGIFDSEKGMVAAKEPKLIERAENYE